jgi:hypothetical protein
MRKYRMVKRHRSGVTSYVVQGRFLFIWNDVDNGGNWAGHSTISFHTRAEAEKEIYTCRYGNRGDVVLEEEPEL